MSRINKQTNTVQAGSRLQYSTIQYNTMELAREIAKVTMRGKLGGTSGAALAELCLPSAQTEL